VTLDRVFNQSLKGLTMRPRHTDFPVPKLTSRIMRNMQPGDTIYVDAGHRVKTNKNMFQNQVNATARASMMGMDVSTRVMHLVNASQHEMTTVVAVYCIEAARPLEKRGRKKGGKNRVKQVEEVPQSDAV